MPKYPVQVLHSGAVLLGPDIVCDGFHRDYPFRVQTHVHDDHMENFDTSKGLQDIYLTEPTRLLLIAEYDADLPYHYNIRPIALQRALSLRDSRLTLLSSAHMLGAVQVAVELSDGTRVGYSGDFQWPLEQVIQVDALVVDSTYGSPASKRGFSQSEVDSRLQDLVKRQLHLGPVYIKAHRGTAERALHVLSGNIDCPMLGSLRFLQEVAVYHTCGYAIDPIISSETPEGDTAVRHQRYVRIFTKGDDFPADLSGVTTIVLSAFMRLPDDPLLEYSDRAYRLAMSNHADFDGTMEYIASTGAKYVMTDNSRGGHAIDLAQEISLRLNIRAEPSAAEFSREWGV